jgi:hypothetical protein
LSHCHYFHYAIITPLRLHFDATLLKRHYAIADFIDAIIDIIDIITPLHIITPLRHYY